jgi:ATP-dependent helicase/nuclease subunit B
MPTIARVSMPAPWRPPDLWPEVARVSLHWLAETGVSPRDAVVLLPFVGLLDPARAAFAAAAGPGGWQPRVETPLTLAAALGSAPEPAAGQCSGDAVFDRLGAAQLLRGEAWGRAWATRDAVGFALLVEALADAAGALREAAGTLAPPQRAAFWRRAREAVGEPGGAALLEGLLLQVAMAWAEQGLEPATDRLFDHHPGAWIVLRLGGAEPTAEALLDASTGTPGLLLDADPAADEPFAAVAAFEQQRIVVCDDFEAEAQATAAVVIDALNAGVAPVALVALDRELLRRVRALLERARVPVIDETGWKLATTAAAARLMAPLRAAAAGAARDDHLRWLKTWPPAQPRALRALEALWRSRRPVEGHDAALALWQQAQVHLAPLHEARVLPLAQWLQRLAALQQADGTWGQLMATRDGQQVLQALGLPEPVHAAWHDAAAALPLTLAEFTAWVAATLEQQSFLPLPQPGALVRITPLARAYGRGFARVVIPGCDHRHLGHEGPPPGLIGDTLARSLGLPDGAARRARQQVALAHALRADSAVLLRRQRQDAEPLGESPALQWLCGVRARLQLPPWPAERWVPAQQAVPAAPVARPLPVAAGALPAWLSASRLEALRQCPYRFFARAVLGLDEPQELDAAIAKRDYGEWLHDLLHHFHSHREHGAEDGGDDAAQLRAAAAVATKKLDLDAAELLPFAASFERLAPAYLAWLREREAQGWRWAEGETDHTREPGPEPGQGPGLRGRFDRIDEGPGGIRFVIDYKTGRAEALRKKVAEPLEDTQLAFYAAVLEEEGAPATPIQACYLALDDEASPLVVEHPQVQRSATILVQALAGEWARLEAGAPLPALGEGAVCDTCEGRGLCRRDHWPGEAHA